MLPMTLLCLRVEILFHKTNANNTKGQRLNAQGKRLSSSSIISAVLRLRVQLFASFAQKLCATLRFIFYRKGHQEIQAKNAKRIASVPTSLPSVVIFFVSHKEREEYIETKAKCITLRAKRKMRFWVFTT